MSHRNLSRALAIAGCITILASGIVAQNDWTQQSTSTSPSARSHMRMSYDVGLGGMIMFGGQGGVGSLGETWFYNGADWAQLTPVASPSNRADYALEYDFARGVQVLFGGVGGFFPDNELWEFNGVTWTQVVPALSPQGRNASDLAFDSSRGVHVLFGGQGFSFIPFNDTWEYDGNTGIWTQIPNAGAAPFRRAGHRMVYDSARNRVVLFGGQDEVLMQGDTWEYNGVTQTWAQITPANSPSPRRDYGMTYDIGRGVTVLHGGLDANFTPLNDTWEYDGVNWTQITTSNSPSTRGLAAMEYNAATGDVNLFGGTSQGVANDETWHYGAAVPGPAYPGNGTDAAINVGINGAADTPVTNVHSVAVSDLLTIQYASPGGTLNGAPFLSFLQVFPTGTTIPQEPVLGVYFSGAFSGSIIVDGLTNPFAVLNPALGAYFLVGTLPPTLAGTNTSFLVNLLTLDNGFPPFNLGIADAHEFQIQ